MIAVRYKGALPRNGSMFLALQQSSARLTRPLWCCNVSRSCFTATMAWSCSRRRIVFLDGGLAGHFPTLIIRINFWNSGFSVWLNGMLPEMKNLRICSLTSFCVHSFWASRKNFESGALAAPLAWDVSRGICWHFTSMCAFITDVGALFLTPARGCWKIRPQNLQAIAGALEAWSYPSTKYDHHCDAVLTVLVGSQLKRKSGYLL